MDAYLNYVFNTSVEKTFHEFRRGFFLVCDWEAVKLFGPEELQGVLVGSEDFDWAKLKQVRLKPRLLLNLFKCLNFLKPHSFIFRLLPCFLTSVSVFTVCCDCVGDK